MTTASGTVRLPVLGRAAFCVLSVVYYLIASTAIAPHITCSPQCGLAIESVPVGAGWILWRPARTTGSRARLLAGVFFPRPARIDRPLWPQYPVFPLRLAFDHLLVVAIGIAMVVVVLERARARTDELNDKMRRLTLLTAASTQTFRSAKSSIAFSVNLVGSLSATHGIVRLIEGEGDSAQLVVQASVGFSKDIPGKASRNCR